MKKPVLYWFSGAALVAVLAAGAALAALALADPALRAGPGSPAGRRPGGLLEGSRARAWEKRFEEALALRGPAVSFWALLRWGLFAEGTRGVLAGREGWLFTAEEFQSALDLDPALRVDEAAVREVRDQLERRGLRLVVALVPAKARVYAEKLGRYALPAPAQRRYRELQDLLAGLGIAAPDLLAPLRRARQEGDVFLRHDTHWSPLGAGAAAEALAGAVEAALREAGSPRSAFRCAQGPPREYPGDLLNFLPLGPFAGRWGPRPEMVRPRLVEAAEPAAGGLFDQPAIPVVLVGSSYSAGELCNLEGALKAAVRADVLNVSKQGQGPLAPMRALLAGEVPEEGGAEVVVWEIPERYFVSAGAGR